MHYIKDSHPRKVFKNSEEEIETMNKSDSENFGEDDEEKQSFRECLTSSLFLLNVIYFGILCLRLNFFMSSYFTWISDLVTHLIKQSLKELYFFHSYFLKKF